MLGEMLKQSMDEKGLTRDQMAKILEITPSYISLLLQNKKVPSFRLGLRISKELGVSLDSLAKGGKQQRAKTTQKGDSYGNRTSAL